MYVLAALLLLGLVCNLLVRPVEEKHYMTDAEVAAEKKISIAAVKHEEEDAHADFEDFVEEALDPVAGAARVKGAPSANGVDVILLAAWIAVGVPLAWGIWMTLQKTAKLFL